MTCPDPGLIAAHVERRLEPSEAARMDEHIAGCADCYQVFADTVEFGLAEGGAARDHRIPAHTGSRLAPARRRLIQLAAGLAMAAGLFGALTLVRSHRAPVSAVAQLVEAIGTQRFVEPRLTGGFAHGRLVVLRSGEAPQKLDAQPAAVIAAVAKIRAQAEGDTSPKTLGALGVTYLVSGDVAAAVKALESATAQEPDNPGLLSDLAAAYLARAEQMDEPADLPKALEVAEKAITLKNPPTEVWFNRALALEKLHLVDAARKAWDDYLERDAASGWADEARQHRDALPPGRQSSVEEDKARVRAALEGGQAAVDHLADEDPSLLRDYFEDDLLPAWAEAHLVGHPDANLHRERARLIGDALFRTTTDALPKATARALAEPVAPASSDPLRSQALGYRAFREGKRLYAMQGSACATFQATRSDLERGGSPYAASARLQVVVSCLYPAEPREGLARLQGLESEARAQGSMYLLGRVEYMKGLLHAVDGQLTQSQQELRLALGLFETTGDTERTAWTAVKMAENLQFLGDEQNAWRDRLKAIALLDRIRTPLRRLGILEEAVATCSDQRLPRTASHFSTAAVDVAGPLGPLALSDVLIRRARLDHWLGARDQAAAHGLDAHRWAARISDASLAEGQRAEVNALEGEMLLDSQPERAAQLLEQALAYQRKPSPVRVPALQLLLAHAHLLRGADDAAEGALVAGIEAMERGRTSLHDVALQTSFFEQALPLFDDMVRLQLDRRHDPERALVYVERGRGRQMVDTLAGQPIAPFDLLALERELPDGLALVYFLVLEDRLCVWVLSREGSHLIERPLTAAQLSRLVAAHRAALEVRASVDVVRRAAARLYDELVLPLTPFIAPDRALVFIPDGILQGVAFAGLWNRETKRYLVEDYVLGLAPSGTVFVQASRRAGTVSAVDLRALVVGNPRVDRKQWAGLPNLPGAEEEAKVIAALYGKAQLLTGSEATEEAFVRGARASTVVHFAGHASGSTDAPSLARLLFAPDSKANASGAFYLRDLARARVERTRVVVLAACRTAQGAISRVEGALSLGRPFLAAGAPSVVTSLWEIDDASSIRFFLTFHRALIAHGEPLLALRQAQMTLLRSQDPYLAHPNTWAAFVHMGGTARHSFSKGDAS